MVPRFLPHIFPDFIQAFLHLLRIKPMGHRQEFIPAVTSHELLCGHGFPQAGGKAVNIGISRFMSHAVIDSAQIVQIKTAHAHIFRCRFRIVQQFFTFVFIGKSRSTV